MHCHIYHHLSLPGFALAMIRRCGALLDERRAIILYNINMISEEGQQETKKEGVQQKLNPEISSKQVGSSDMKAPLLLQNLTLPAPALCPSQDLYLQAQNLIRANRTQQSIPLLQRCIEEGVDKEGDFLGLGCFEDRVGYHYGDIWDWVSYCQLQSKKKASAHDLLSLCLSVSDHMSDRRQWYLRMLQKKENYQLWLGLAHLQYNQKKFVEAEELYKKVTLIRPDASQPLLKLAFIYCLKWNRDEEAAKWAEMALGKENDNFYALLIKALCGKDLSKRVQQLQQLIDVKPDYARPYNGLGNALYNQKRYKEAIKAYERCIGVSRKYEHPYYGLGSIYNQLGDLDKSIEWYKKCIAVNPSYDFPHYGLGIAYNNKNDTAQAIHWFKECIRISPNYDCPYYALGNIYRLSHDYPTSVQYYRRSLAIKPLDPLCFVNLAIALIAQSHFEEAMGYLVEAEKHVDEDKMLSNANIEYIREQLEFYLGQTQKHQRRLLGMITLREMIVLQQSQKAFQKQFHQIYSDC